MCWDHKSFLTIWQIHDIFSSVDIVQILFFLTALGYTEFLYPLLMFQFQEKGKWWQVGYCLVEQKECYTNCLIAGRLKTLTNKIQETADYFSNSILSSFSPSVSQPNYDSSDILPAAVYRNNVVSFSDFSYINYWCIFPSETSVYPHWLCSSTGVSDWLLHIAYLCARMHACRHTHTFNFAVQILSINDQM